MRAEAGSATGGSATSRQPAWFELEASLLVLLVALAFFTRLDRLPIRGDESNWAIVAQEMISGGDWIVPRRQGEPFADRPPLNSWCIAISSWLCGRCDAFSIRLPSVTAVLITTLSIYFYSRRFLSSVGALAAAATFATMAHQLRMGRLAESDNLLTCCLVSSLFVWSAGYLQGRSPLRTWMISYFLAAFAALAKGPQGPVYFVAITSGFLILRRDWRYLFSTAHLAGIVTMVAVLGAWFVPFCLRTDLTSALNVWSEQGRIGERFDYSDWRHGLRHLVFFPIWLFGSMLPWSFLLIPLVSRRLRESFGATRPYAQFLGLCWLLTLPTVWLSPDSGPRYIMSMYPIAAALVGMVVAHTWKLAGDKFWETYWSRFLLGNALMFGGASFVFFACGRGLPIASLDRLKQPLGLAVVYIVFACAASFALLRARRNAGPLHAKIAILSLAGLMCAVVSGAWLDTAASGSIDPAREVAEVRTRLPSDVRLVSLGPAHHRFLYYYQSPVEQLDWTVADRELPPHVDYFCVTQAEGVPVGLPFDWEPVGTISCDRAPRTDANRVVIGRVCRASSEKQRERRPIIVAEGTSGTILR